MVLPLGMWRSTEQWTSSNGITGGVVSGEDVAAYVQSCPVCQRMKSDNRKEAGDLQPIPFPERAWQEITTDLVTDLPE